ncbi:hypothetical protein cyc_06776 [Cyclospora cayetanensis]|uniref:Uncharacterized protein n=1 Tax=Cyclospora cayetanensis TaxID=88456 RepID=A0A1D3CUH3_9EIME|nr:hypothetical protein cyc_06776 [Cyclospora cayetanensis]
MKASTRKDQGKRRRAASPQKRDEVEEPQEDEAFTKQQPEGGQGGGGGATAQGAKAESTKRAEHDAKGGVYEGGECKTAFERQSGRGPLGALPSSSEQLRETLQSQIVKGLATERLEALLQRL